MLALGLGKALRWWEQAPLRAQMFALGTLGLKYMGAGVGFDVLSHV